LREPQKGSDSAPVTETLLEGARALAQHLGVDLVRGAERRGAQGPNTRGRLCTSAAPHRRQGVCPALA
jgi:hypothetical protein